MAKVMQLVDPKMLTTATAPVNPLYSTISNLDQEMRLILERHDLSDEQKVRQYNQILQRYLEYHNHLQETTTTTTSTTSPKNIREEVLQTVPKTMKRKAEAILERIAHHSNMGWNDRGEFVYDGEVARGSNIVDLVNDMLRHRKTFQPRGWQEFARALRQSNVPLDLVGNRHRWEWMHRDSATSDAFSTAEESSPPRRSKYKTPAQKRSVSQKRQSRTMHKTPAQKRSVSEKIFKREPVSVKKEIQWDT